MLFMLLILCAAVFDVLQYAVMRGGSGHLHCFYILRLIQNGFDRHTGAMRLRPHTVITDGSSEMQTQLQQFH